MGQVEWARELARSLLEYQLPRRWAHTQGVAAKAETLRSIVGNDTDVLTAAAWLHDIGYSPTLVVTGFHPIDGARYLRDVRHASLNLCSVVAHHTGALIEAEERGLADVLRYEFPLEKVDLVQALTYCDMLSGPDGQSIEVQERLAEIVNRYGPGHVVSRSILRSTPAINAAVESISRRLS